MLCIFFIIIISIFIYYDYLLFLLSLLLLILLLPEVLHLKGRRIKADPQAWMMLTHVINQLYSVYCLTVLVFKGVPWGDVNNIKIMSKNISSTLSLTYPNFCVDFSTGARHRHIPKNFLTSFSVLAN